MRADGDPFVIPGGPVVPVITCGLLVWLFSATVQRDQLIALLVVLTVVGILYALRAWRQRAIGHPT